MNTNPFEKIINEAWDNKSKVNTKSNKKINETILKGDFLDDQLYFNFKNNKLVNDSSKIFTLKLLNAKLFTEVELQNSKLNKDILSGKALIKKNKNRLTSLFEYRDNKILLKNSNLKNVFLDGNLNGEIKFNPFFSFNINIDLNSMNFSRFHTLLLKMNDLVLQLEKLCIISSKAK